MGSVFVVMTLICQDKAGKCFLYIKCKHLSSEQTASQFSLLDVSPGWGAALRQIASSVHVVLMRSSKDMLTL